MPEDERSPMVEYNAISFKCIRIAADRVSRHFIIDIAQVIFSMPSSSKKLPSELFYLQGEEGRCFFLSTYFHSPYVLV